MTRVDAVNGAAAIGVLVLALIAAMSSSKPEPAVIAVRVAAGAPPGVDLRELAGGGLGVVDASGQVVPVREYRRVASASTVSDWIVESLCANQCAVAYTERSARHAPWRHDFAGTPTIAGLSDLEPILALAPELVLIDSFGDPRRVARLREHGLVVFDLGQMRGAADAARAMRTVGVLLGRRARGERLAARYLRELGALAADVESGSESGPGAGSGPRAGPRAAYVSAYGPQLFGAGAETTYHDVLSSAGLEDAAAAAGYEGFVEYSTEQLLVLDPPLIVTHVGGAGRLCRRPGLDRLRACRAPPDESDGAPPAAGIVELDAFALDDPGLGILESAETLHHAVYGRRTPRSR